MSISLSRTQSRTVKRLAVEVSFVIQAGKKNFTSLATDGRRRLRREPHPGGQVRRIEVAFLFGL